MKVELLYFEDCPNWKVAGEHLRVLADGRDVQVEHRLVHTPEEADAAGFRGSPTILIEGRDPFAAGDEPFGLACRVYQTPGGAAGSPTLDQLAAALEAVERAVTGPISSHEHASHERPDPVASALA